MRAAAGSLLSRGCGQLKLPARPGCLLLPLPSGSRACAAPLRQSARRQATAATVRAPQEGSRNKQLAPLLSARAVLPLHSRTAADAAHQPVHACLSPARWQQLELLEVQLGHKFRDLGLLHQACTHDVSGLLPSYRQLAFIGDAALWLLFAEHAFRTRAAVEDAASGAWPAQLSGLLSRASCAATARQWGLDAFLQHSSGSSCLSRTSSLESTSSSSSTASSSSRGSGMHGGCWNSDSLAEMFEGVVGALLLDAGGDYEEVKQQLLPWVAASFDAARRDVGTAAAAASAGPGTGAAAGISSSVACTLEQERPEQLCQLMEQQLQGVCSYSLNAPRDFRSTSSRHAALLLTRGHCSPEVSSSMRFMGFSLLQFAAALHAYGSHIGHQHQPHLLWQLWQPPAVMQAARQHQASLVQLPGWRSDEAVLLRAHSGNSSSSSNEVHRAAKHASQLTTLRHRCKMWLWLMQPAPWCDASSPSFVVNAGWKRQKQAMAHSLDILLAGVYLDGGLAPALHTAAVLLAGTPPTLHDKSWMPAWTQQR